jgi:hypothetical protein
VAIAETGGKDVVGIEPRGRLVFSVAPLPASDPAVRAALARGHAEYVAAKAEENVIARFAEALAALPGKPIAVLPPSPASPPVSLATRAGLMRHAVELTPRELVDEGAFSAARFPVALYAGGENYVHTVGSSGDAAQAMVRYVNTGGTLLLVSMGPFPMFYGERPGGKVAEPLPSRLGMPIYNSIEVPPQAKLTVEMASGQTFVEGVPASFAYPAGDPRLRSINPSLIPTGARYTPICRVRDASGKGYGDAAGIVDLGTGKGSVLYVWGGLMRDDRYGPAFSAAIVRFMVAKAGAAGHR